VLIVGREPLARVDRDEVRTVDPPLALFGIDTPASRNLRHHIGCARRFL
jgi:hypothetical protein